MIIQNTKKVGGLSQLDSLYCEKKCLVLFGLGLKTQSFYYFFVDLNYRLRLNQFDQEKVD